MYLQCKTADVNQEEIKALRKQDDVCVKACTELVGPMAFFPAPSRPGSHMKPWVVMTAPALVHLSKGAAG